VVKPLGEKLQVKALASPPESSTPPTTAERATVDVARDLKRRLPTPNACCLNGDIIKNEENMKRLESKPSV
jgi:hypothetical protein